VHERRLGTDHHQVRPAVDREAGDGGRVHGIHFVQFSDRADARVSGCRHELVNRGIRRQGQGEGVFAAPTADQQYAHPRTLPTRRDHEPMVMVGASQNT
jgi:hypothetical protein